MKKTNLLNFPLLLFVLVVISFFSCRKFDNFPKDKFNVYEKFFELPQNADPALARVIKTLKDIESQNPFVEQFVKSEGYPIWKNAKVSVSNKFLSRGANEGGDTTITIPIVPVGEEYVKDLLKIKLEQELLFKLFKSEEYVLNGFDKSADRTKMNADEFVAQIMTFEKEMFNQEIYKIIDNRLFNYWDSGFNLPTEFYISAKMIPCEVSITIYEWTTGGENVGCPPGPAPCYGLIPRVIDFHSFPATCEEEDGGSGGSGGDNGGWSSSPLPGVPSGEGGSGSSSGTTNPQCNLGWVKMSNTVSGKWLNMCTKLPPVKVDESINVDVISSPLDPEYPDISDSEPQVSLQSLFNCFNQIPDAGATYSVKICVDLPVNGVWDAPFNLTQKSPGHTFLTLTKSNGTQSISQTVGFYPVGSLATPFYPTATGGFKNNGLPEHEYNASINANNINATQFSSVMNNLLSHENDTYNIFYNNCTTIALNAFNLLINQPITLAPFVVSVPTLATTFTFMHSPQRLYKAIDSFHPGLGLIKEFNVNNDSPLSTRICP